jgi:hypothetical protein
MSYQLNKAHLLICIFAGLVLTGGFVWLLFFGSPFPLFSMAMWVSASIVVFYVVGHFARSILIRDVFVPEDEYDFSQDEEYQAFMESLENDDGELSDVMFDDPVGPEDLDFEDSLDEPFMELETAS